MLNTNDKKNLKIINAFISSNIDKNQNYYFQSGYKNFGILLVGFCKWIHEQNKKEKNKIFFLSRDGYIIQKAYKILYPEEETSYLYVSRRSLALPSMKNAKNIEDVINSLVLPPIFSIDTLLNALQLSPKETKKELKEAEIRLDNIFKRCNFEESKKIQNLLEALYPKIISKAENQHQIFSKYLLQEKFKDKVTIVDIGWHNSLQKQLLKITNDNIKIKGRYIGTYKNAYKFSKDNQAKGYIYSYGNKMNKQFRTFSFVSLFETMFLSHEGTTIGYKYSKDKYSPILLNYEYENDNKSLNIVNSFQQGGLKFIEDYKNSNLDVELNSNICSYNILKFGSSPTKKDIEMFGNISFENYKIHNIINFNNSSIYYFCHPKDMIKDFYTSGWRVAFLKKLFKLPLPYFYLLKILCVVFKKEQ